MTTNEFEVDKILLCGNCGQVHIDPDTQNCERCNGVLEEIGFLPESSEKGIRTAVGGSTKPGKCKCGGERASKGLDNLGRRRYRTECYKCLYKARIIPKADSCKICGIKPKDKSNLHRDHIDGDRSNNSTKNIQTLCVECHQYKTKKQQDWKKKNV